MEIKKREGWVWAVSREGDNIPSVTDAKSGDHRDQERDASGGGRPGPGALGNAEGTHS